MLAAPDAHPNSAFGAAWVSIHYGIGFTRHAGMVIVADGAPAAARWLERVLTDDPASGVMRHADAINLFHGVLGLSYCDFYITRDGFARACAIAAKKALPAIRTAEIHGTIVDLARALIVDRN